MIKNIKSYIHDSEYARKLHWQQLIPYETTLQEITLYT